MKKICLLLLVAVLLPGAVAHAQVAPATEMLAAMQIPTYVIDRVQQITYFAEMLTHIPKEVDHWVKQAENMAHQTKNQLENLGKIKDVNNFNSLMDWYNHQIDLEKRTEDMFKSLNVNIGKKNYKFTDIEGMARGFSDTYIDYWNNEFTEDQRREMWLNLGLTPSNYAYLQTWKGRVDDWRQVAFASVYLQEENARVAAEKNAAYKKRIADDPDFEAAEQLGQKEMFLMQLDMLIEINRALNDMATYQAYMMQRQAMQDYLDDTPRDEPAVSEDFTKSYFQRLKK